MKPTITPLAYRPAVCSDRPTTLQLLVRLEAPRLHRRDRPHLNLGLAIDRSGSMEGAPLDNARRACAHIVRQLHRTDQVSVVSFDCVAEVQVPCRPVADAAPIVARLERLFARGNTALHQGWLEACHETCKGASKRRLSRVILLSDGQANVGLIEPDRIAAQVAQWQRDGISTSTIGLGLHYNEDLLAAMARAGNGSFYHVAEPKDVEPCFQIELQSMLAAFGRAVSLGVEPAPGVEVLRVVNPLQTTPKKRFKVGDLVHGNPIEVVFEILVPAMKQERDLLTLRLAWTDVETGERCYASQPIRLPVVPYGQLSEFPVCPEVLQKRAVQHCAQVLLQASRLLEKRDYSAARAALQGGLQNLREAPSCGEVDHAAEQLTRLLKSLDVGSYSEVRKQATYSSSSMTMSSLSLSGGVREWMKLPEAERTPERLSELMGDASQWSPS